MAGALRLAHRGDWRVAPENSLAAMRAALANPGCDGLEFDVQGSAEGVPILLHDATLERVQGIAERVDQLTARELEAFGIPSLASVLEAVGPRPFLDIELKGPYLPSVISVIEAARGAVPERTVISSFETPTLRDLAVAGPTWHRWLNALELRPATLDEARSLGCRGVSVAWRSIDAAGIGRARAAGLEVAAWTIRRRPTAARLERLGVAVLCVEAAALDG